MIDFLQDIDTQIFLALNGFHAGWLDWPMYVVSSKWVWVPFYIWLLVMVKRSGINYRQTILCLCTIALAITIADQGCASLIRPLVCRPRPANVDSPIRDFVHIVNDYRGGHYGFPSCHAANSAALAVFMILFFRKRWAVILFTTWMLLLCYSRIYLGVHYPGDLLVGAVIGSFAGYVCYMLYARLKDVWLFTKPLSPAFPEVLRRM